MTKKYRMILVILWIFFAILIITGSLMPTLASTDKYHFDKFLHGAAYAGLMFLAYLYANNKLTNILLMASIIMLGGAIELIQLYLPGRSGTIGDFIADAVGVFIGLLIAYKIKPWLIKRFK